MIETYCFIGDEGVGRFVARQLEEFGLQRRESALEADVALTYCLHAGALEDAYFDDEGLIKNAAENMVLVDLSPSTPSFSRELSAVAAVNDLVFVEAPLVVENPVDVCAFPSAENLVCYAACEGDGLDKVMPLLEALAGVVVETGAIGTAQLAKAAHTVQFTSQIVGAVESCVLEMAVRDASNSVEGLAGGNVALGEVSRTMHEAVIGEAFDDGLPLAYFMADVVAAMSTADDVDLILPQLEAAMHLLELMAVIGGADKGPAALSLLYREEEASAAHGLDWTRAEGLYADGAHEGHDHDFDDDEGGYDDFGFMGGFGGYSSN